MTRTHPYVIALRLLLPIALGAPLFSEVRSNPWVKLSTPYFSLYTSQEEARAVQLVQLLERIRLFFTQTDFSRTLPATPVTVIVCGNESDCEQYRVNRRSYAYYQRSWKDDYIVLPDLNPRHNDVAVHEYTHFVLEHSALKLPLWLKEGMADLYSSLDFRGRQSVFGEALQGRMLALEKLPPLDVEQVIAIDRGSRYYREPESMQAFYAQSWLLTHMLALDDTYSQGFPLFLSRISDGLPAQECFRSIYGKSLREIDSDLRRYRTRSSLPVRLLDIDTAAIPDRPARIKPLQQEVDRVFANLLASNPYAQAEAGARLVELSRQYPQSPEFEESLGFLALQQNRPEEAYAHFRSAVERQSADPTVLHYFDIGCINLALNAVKSDQFDQALAALSKVKGEEPGIAYEFFYTQSYCYLHLKNVEQARTAGIKAKQYARTAQQKQQVENLLRYIGSPELLASATTLN